MAPPNAVRASDQLIDQLQAAEAADKTVQVWFRLKAENPTQPAASRERTEILVRRVLDRVENAVGESAVSMNIQHLLGTFTVLARPKLVQEILHQPEIASAGAAQIPGFGLIKPVKRQSVKVKNHSRRPRRAK